MVEHFSAGFIDQLKIIFRFMLMDRCSKSLVILKYRIYELSYKSWLKNREEDAQNICCAEQTTCCRKWKITWVISDQRSDLSLILKYTLSTKARNIRKLWHLLYQHAPFNTWYIYLSSDERPPLYNTLIYTDLDKRIPFWEIWHSDGFTALVRIWSWPSQRITSWL